MRFCFWRLFPFSNNQSRITELSLNNWKTFSDNACLYFNRLIVLLFLEGSLYCIYNIDEGTCPDYTCFKIRHRDIPTTFSNRGTIKSVMAILYPNKQFEIFWNSYAYKFKSITVENPFLYLLIITLQKLIKNNPFGVCKILELILHMIVIFNFYSASHLVQRNKSKTLPGCLDLK